MRFIKVALLPSLAIIIAAWSGENLTNRLAAQTPSSQGSATAADQGAPPDNLQRSAEILYFKRIAQSGPKRGQEIYFFKCWICHNEYTVKAEYGDKGSYMLLNNLYKQPTLLNGQPVNDKTVTEWIRNGDKRMPSYRYALTDQDLADLVSYIREACCWDDDHVPANPRYHPE